MCIWWLIERFWCTAIFSSSIGLICFTGPGSDKYRCQMQFQWISMGRWLFTGNALLIIFWYMNAGFWVAWVGAFASCMRWRIWTGMPSLVKLRVERKNCKWILRALSMSSMHIHVISHYHNFHIKVTIIMDRCLWALWRSYIIISITCIIIITSKQIDNLGTY